MAADAIVSAYVARYGAAALAVPPDQGHNRGVYALPIAAIAAGAVAGVMIVRRWRARGAAVAAGRAGAAQEAPREDDATRAEYDRRLDEELRGLDE
jgi:cytochrome c-type biogenesis protein CcmH/NrfF